jgi:transcriptional regulator with XRE-family HTH domain
MSPTQRQIGKRIQTLRKHQHLSRQELAEKARVSREYIRKLEAGGYDPTVGRLQRIACALKVPLTELLE